MSSSHICCIVPPYLLRGIVESQAIDDEDTRQFAQKSLNHRDNFTAKRCDRFSTLSQPRASRAQASTSAPRGIVPEGLLSHIAESQDVDQATRDRARADIEHTRRVIAAYQKGL